MNFEGETLKRYNPGGKIASVDQLMPHASFLGNIGTNTMKKGLGSGEACQGRKLGDWSR